MFIETQKGRIINPNHVASANVKRRPDATRIEFMMKDGRCIEGGVSHDHRYALPEMIAPVVKADPGYWAVSVHVDETVTYVVEEQVIAWRIVPGHDCPMPISLGMTATAEARAIRKPDGKVCAPEVGEWPDLDQWHEYVVGQIAQREARAKAV